MRKITNSAGLTGAIPTSQIGRPASMSAGVIVSGLHRTRNACSSEDPWRAPLRQIIARKSDIVSLTRAQVVSSYGSKTTHCVPSRSDSSIMMNKRRTLTYRHRGINRHRACVPDADAASVVAEIANVVCGGFVNAALSIRAGKDTCDVPTGRHERRGISRP